MTGSRLVRTSLHYIPSFKHGQTLKEQTATTPVLTYGKGDTTKNGGKWMLMFEQRQRVTDGHAKIRPAKTAHDGKGNPDHFALLIQ